MMFSLSPMILKRCRYFLLILLGTACISNAGGMEAGDATHRSSLRNSERELQTDEFTGRFLIDYELTSDAIDLIQPGDIVLSPESSFNDIQNTLRPIWIELMLSYNSLNTNDPFNRQLEQAGIVSGVVFSSQENDGRNRRRQQDSFLTLQLLLEVGGRCNGCGSDAALTNQVTHDGGGRHKRALTYDRVEDPGLSLPTEEELLIEYSARISALNNELVESVLSLEEVDVECPSSATNDDDNGVPVLSQRTLQHCPFPLSPGFLVLDIDQPGLWCVSGGAFGQNLRLEACDFDTPQASNDQAWTIISSSLTGNSLQQGSDTIIFQSTRYSNRCIGVYGGSRFVTVACNTISANDFVFDFAQNYLRYNQNCVKIAGTTANEGDTINFRSCPTSSDNDETYQWLFLFP